MLRTIIHLSSFLSHQVNSSAINQDKPDQASFLSTGSAHVSPEVGPIPPDGTAQLQNGSQDQNIVDTCMHSHAESVCSVCLGVLQSLDGPAAEVSSELMTALSDIDGAGASWHPMSHGSPISVAQHVKQVLHFWIWKIRSLLLQMQQLS